MNPNHPSPDWRTTIPVMTEETKSVNKQAENPSTFADSNHLGHHYKKVLDLRPVSVTPLGAHPFLIEAIF